MAIKKNNYIEEELDWLEARAADIKAKVDANPYDKIRDRTRSFTTPKGIMEKLISSIEVQEKAYREALKDYHLLVEAIGNLREKKELAKKQIRGDEDLSPLEDGLLDEE